MKFIIFSKPNCVQCNSTYRALDKFNLKKDDGDYTIVDISVDENAYKYALSLGHSSAPIVTIVEAGVTLEQLMDPEHSAVPVESWGGFRPDAIKKAFDTYPALLPALVSEPVLV